MTILADFYRLPVISISPTQRLVHLYSNVSVDNRYYSVLQVSLMAENTDISHDQVQHSCMLFYIAILVTYNAVHQFLVI